MGYDLLAGLLVWPWKRKHLVLQRLEVPGWGGYPEEKGRMDGGMIVGESDQERARGCDVK